jgi:acetyl-CoA C-acetyltransferase
MAAGVPKEVPAWSLNQVCGSGLRAVAVAAQSIIAGDARVVVAGGQESMSLSAHAQHVRGGTKMGNMSLIDTMVNDGLMDAFNGYHMGITAENLAERYQITATSRTPSPALPRTRRRPRAARAASTTRSHPSPSRAARATRWSTATSSSAKACRWRASPA